MSDEIVIQITSIESWSSDKVWSDVYRLFEAHMGCEPDKLDARDPLRRRYGDFSIEENSLYTSSFGNEETYKVVFGKFPKKRGRFSINLTRNPRISPNLFNLYLQSHEAQLAELLFRSLLSILRPVYAYCDIALNIASKRKANGFAVHLEEELVGIFWCTYICEGYEIYFGKDKIDSIPEIVKLEERPGVLLKLAEDPKSVSPSRRGEIEKILGENSFVDPASTKLKPRGKYIPKFDSLSQ